MTQILALRGIEKTSNAFRAELVRVADRLGLDPSFLGAVMANESGFNPQATNPQVGATGLIQFMPGTAEILGTTTTALRGMSDIQQLFYVEKFYRMVGARAHIRRDVPGDYYMATFMPAFVGAPPDTILFDRDDPDPQKAKGYQQNKGLDVDRDGKIQVRDVWAVIDGIVAAAKARPPIEVDMSNTPLPQPVPGPLPPDPEPPSCSGPPSSSGDSCSPDVSNFPTLRLGSTGPDVRRLQVLLNRRANASLQIDGFFGIKTRSAVGLYQVHHNLVVDCVVGEKTWKSLLTP